MRFNLKRSLSGLMALLMTLSVLFMAVACGETNENPVDEATHDSVSDTEAATESPYAQLPKENYNREFVILSRDDCLDDYKIESLTGDLLDDSIYERNVTVANDYGITFVYYEEDGYDKVNDSMKLQVSGGLDDYDMYIGHKYSFNALARGNYCYNLGAISSIDLTGEWWDQACYENLSIDGKTYIMTGDINPCSMRISACFTFNKDMMTELGKSPRELNDLTANGGWTLDVLLQYSTDVTMDLNGDGELNYTNDRFCLSSWMMDVPFSLFYGAGGKFIEMVDGTPELTYTDESVTNIYEKMYNIIVGQKAYYVTDVSVYPTTYDVFREGRALFCDITLNKITNFISDMDDAYGILPMPKYDTYQKEYLSFVNGATSMVMVAKTEADPEFVGTIMEAMAVYNYEKVTPNMFQVVTKLQTAQDPESAAMVDYIIRNRIYDLAYYCDFDVSNLVKDRLAAGEASVASGLKRGRDMAKRALTQLMKSYEKCD